MSQDHSIADIARSLVEDPAYRKALTAQIEARTADQDLVRRFIAYARERQATSGHAVVRQMLTAAGVSWEAL